MLSYLLLLLLPLSLAQDFGVAGGGPAPPVAGGGPSGPPSPNNEQHEFTFGNLPRVCVECCMDIMFVVDRSEAVMGPTGDKRVYWERIMALVADFGAGPLNHPKIRIGAMQMGDASVISQATLASADATGSAKTGIRFPLSNGPFPDAIKKRTTNGVDSGWGINDVFSVNRAWATAAQVALDHFKSVNPIYVNDQRLCTPANSVRLMIWIVSGGPVPSNNDPCLGSPSLMAQLNEAEVQQHIVGIGDAWEGAIQGRRCMFSTGADLTGNLINAGKPISQISTLLKPEQFAIDPCNKCSGYVDVVFVLDESGSFCDDIPGNSSLESGICPKRTEFDLQVDFVGRIIAELGKSWNRHRVAIWTFATKMRNWVKIGQTGGKSASHYPNGNPTYAWNTPMTEQEVQDKLVQIKAGFAEGFTATALAYKEALGEIEWAPPREDGNKAKKVVVFLTDGGPNPPYYVVDENGERTQCSSGGSANGWCLHWQTFWNGGTNAAQVGQMNMAVCTDEGDPDPKWVRYRQIPGGFEQYIESTLTWADAAKTIDMTPLLIMVGPRREKHIQDIKCLSKDNGGFLTPRTFRELLDSPAYQAAVINSLCTPARLGQSTGVLAEWTKYEAYQQSQLQIAFAKMAMQQGYAPAQSTNVHYAWGAALVIGVSVAFLYGKKSRADYYTPLLSDELMDADRV